jgi:redox-regulated HSP33 family molecular chaperone
MMRSVYSRDSRTDELAHNVRKGLPPLTKTRYKNVLRILKNRIGKGANYSSVCTLCENYLRAIALPFFKKEEQMTTICRTSADVQVEEPIFPTVPFAAAEN